MNDYVVIFGAANIDIGGAPYKTLLHGDSNPGQISISFGGVARNIAHNLSMLGVDVKLVTYIGGDTLGSEMIKHSKDVGIDISNVIIDEKDRSSMYLYINNANGDMEEAISQVKLEQKLTPERIESYKNLIEKSSMSVMDANLSAKSFMKLKSICNHASVPFCVDPVSVAQAGKIKSHLEGIDIIKPNRLEAEFLTDMTIQKEADYRAAAEEFLRQGVKRIFMSMGPDGMIAADKDNMYIIGECPADVKCTTGAGDSATAAIVWSSLIFNSNKQECFEDDNYLICAAKAANAIASLTTEVQETNHPSLNDNLALKRIKFNKMSIKKI